MSLRAALVLLTLPLLHAPAQEDLAERMAFVRTAYTYLGVPFVHGGDSRAGIDSWRLVRVCFERVRGRALPDDLPTLLTVAPLRPPEAAQLGDLLIFGDSDLGTEAGISVGDGRMILAAADNELGVEVLERNHPRWRPRLLGSLDPFQLRDWPSLAPRRAYLDLPIRDTLVQFQDEAPVQAGTSVVFRLRPTTTVEATVVVYAGTYPYPYRVRQRERLSLTVGESRAIETGPLEGPGRYGVLVRDDSGRVLTWLGLRVRESPAR